MFCVRDASIRLILLSHLNLFINVFEKEELKTLVLPELLVGIKDTDDYLVSTTLHALADLVPILGSTIVIGGNRGKLFADGRPMKIQRHKKSGINLNRITDSSMLSLPERPSPDGGEDKEEINFSYTEEENWSDWETQEIENNEIKNLEFIINRNKETNENIYQSNETEIVDKTLKSTNLEKKCKYLKNSISDINELDIKNSKPINNDNNDDFDFFTDMEPVIQKPQIIQIDKVVEKKTIFDVKLTNSNSTIEDDNGWGDDLNDWDIDNVELKE